MLSNEQEWKLKIELLKRRMTYEDVGRKFGTNKQMVSLAMLEKRNSDLAYKIREFMYGLIAD